MKDTGFYNTLYDNLQLIPINFGKLVSETDLFCFKIKSHVQNVLQTWFFNIFLDTKLIPKLLVHRKSKDFG